MTARMEALRCLVTGGGSGIGRAVALRFAAEGASVLVSGRRAAPLEATASTAECIAVLAGDVSNPEDARAMVARTVELYGGLDVVFHAAGVLRRGERLEQTSDAEWSHDLAVNLSGVFNVCRAAIPHLRESVAASVILVASQLAHVGAAGYASYAAAKGGIVGLARSLAIDLGPDGIRVNALSPGLVDSEMAYVGRDFDAIREQAAAAIPLRRVGTPEDMTGAAVFLASADSAWMTGHALVVDGGYTAQ